MSTQQNEIIEMARQAGFPFNKYGLLQGDEEGEIDADAMFEIFAKLVAAKEREAINSLAEKELLNTSALMSMPPQSSAAWNILQAIRARGEA